MEISFQNWLYDCFEDGSLTVPEIEEILQDRRKAYDLFVEDFLGNDRISTAEMVQAMVFNFKRALKQKKK